MPPQKRHFTRIVSRLRTSFLCVCAIVIAAGILGCEVDSFLFDQSRTGRFEFYPTTIPVLERIDVIEQEEDFFANATPVQPEDLMPRELVNRIYPGDVLNIGIYELYQSNFWHEVRRRVDAGGNVRVPELGEVRAAGLTVEEFENEIKRLLAERVMENPQADVFMEQSGALRYTVYGYVSDPGLFSLENANLRLLDALAIAGGVPATTERIFVIRQVVLSEEMRPGFEQTPPEGQRPTTRPPQEQPSVEELIEQLEENRNNRNNLDRPISPGMLRQEDPQDAPDQEPPIVDIDELEPVPAAQQEPPPIDIEEVRPPQPPGEGAGESFIYVEELGEWVRVPGTGAVVQPPTTAGEAPQANLVLDRIIEIDYTRLSRGDSSQNIVIRPNDRIYVEPPLQGFVYIEGEIGRPGVYNLPPTGHLTLSRFIASAGGLPQTAVPERVDLIRKVGPNLEATIRLDLAAIRQRTEPDIYMKPDDMVIIGTNFWATPMAVIRNGFRATYGFGFLLDRNFGNDVFGAAPGEVGGF